MTHQPSFMQTRAQLIGVKPKVIAARTRKAIASIRPKVERLAMPWADVDNSIDGAVQNVTNALDDLERLLEDAVEYLNEVPN